MRNAMDAQEVAVGWWPGDSRYGKAAFYAYAHPAPDGFASATLSPAEARWDAALGEYILDWDDVASRPRSACHRARLRPLRLSPRLCGLRVGRASGRQRRRDAAPGGVSRLPLHSTGGCLLHQLDRVLSLAMSDYLEHPTMGLLLRLLYQLYSLEIQAALRDAGFDDIGPAAANVFTFLTSDGATVSELASLSHVRKQTMAQTVEALERSGYVERRPNPSDRRSQLVLLTARGKRIPRITHKAAAAVERRWARLGGEGELESLRLSLVDLLARLTVE